METERDVYMRVFYILMFLFVLSWFPFPWKQEPARDPILETRSRIERNYVGIQFLLHYDNTFLTNVLNTSGSEDMLDLLAESFPKCPDIATIPFERTDAWGNQFSVSVDKAAITSTTNLLNSEQRYHLIRIWSSGPNGVNEDGEGDDVE